MTSDGVPCEFVFLVERMSPCGSVCLTRKTWVEGERLHCGGRVFLCQEVAGTAGKGVAHSGIVIPINQSVAPEDPAVGWAVVVEWHFDQIVVVCALTDELWQEVTSIAVEVHVVGVGEAHLLERSSRELIEAVLGDADFDPLAVCQFGVGGIAAFAFGFLSGCIEPSGPLGINDNLCADKLLVLGALATDGDE